MVLQIINMLLCVTYIFAILNVSRHLFFLLRILFKNNNLDNLDDEDYVNEKYIISNKALIFLGLSISYIVSGIILGVVFN